MSWYRLFLSSSLGKKYLMGITGLLLCGFLVAHLAGNLLMYVGADAYNTYADTLHSQEWLIKFAELGLLAIFIIHLALAFSLSKQNRAARNVRYHCDKTKEGAETAPFRVDTIMLWSGLAVLGFLLLHLSDFALELSWDMAYEDTKGDHFKKAIMILTNPLRVIVYLAGTSFLFIHLLHGFSSAFRSLGISHPKHNRILRNLGYVFAAVFGLGFATFPIWAKFLR